MNLVVTTQTDDDARLFSAFLTIAYLAEEFMPRYISEPHQQRGELIEEMQQVDREFREQGSPKAMPLTIVRWIRFAQQQADELRKLGIDNIPLAIEQLQGLPRYPVPPSFSETKILVEITPEMTSDHLQQLWGKVVRTRISVWGQSTNNSSPRYFRGVSWKEYERDVQLKEIYDQLGAAATDSAVAEIFGRKGYLSADDISSTELVKKARQRWQRKVKKLYETRKTI